MYHSAPTSEVSRPGCLASLRPCRPLLGNSAWQIKGFVPNLIGLPKLTVLSSSFGFADYRSGRLPARRSPFRLFDLLAKCLRRAADLRANRYIRCQL